MAKRALRTEHHITRNIDEHVALIARQVERSLKDAESRQLAVRIVSNKVEWRKIPGARNGEEAPFVRGWGQWFRMPAVSQCPPRQDACEIDMIWNFIVLNCRYVYDIDAIDTFATLQNSLDAGGGDCDDATIAFGTLLRAVGFQMRARVIATSASPNDWSHIYPLVGMSKDDASQWVPLDVTVTGAVPGWEYSDIAKYKDYQL